MKILFHPREKCKYGMTVISDDDFLSDIFSKRYDCREIFADDCDLKTEDEIYKFFTEVYNKIKNQFNKSTVFFYYQSVANKAFVLEPGSTKINAVDFFQREDLLPIQYLENLLYATLIPEEDVLALHGAAVAKDGKATLLLASTTSGKSTLTAFLWQAGYEYITDDEIFITCKDLMVQPIRKNLSLRQGGFDLLGTAFEKVHKVFDGKTNTYIVIPEEKLRYESYGIEKVVFLAGYGSEEPYFVKLEPRDAFLRLLKGQLSSKNSEGNVAEKYSILTKLAQNTYEMRYSDLWTAEKFLKH